MALYYQILTTRKIPGEILTYSYENRLNLGQLVRVLVRGKLCDGVIFDFIKEENIGFDKQKAKSISKILPASLNAKQLQFLKLISFNTFNSKNDLIKAFLRPFSFLTKANWNNLETLSSDNFNLENLEKKITVQEKIKENSEIDLENNLKKDKKPNISVKFELDSNYLVRIMNLIRSQKTKIKTSSIVNFLIIFPEQKLLDKIYEGISKEFFQDKNLKIYKYSNNGNKIAKWTARKVILDSFKETISIDTIPNSSSGYPPLAPQGGNSEILALVVQREKSFLKAEGGNDTVDKKLSKKSKKDSNLTSYNQTINLFFSTRSGMFLPFTSLEKIILLDEANTMYIQEQNSLYFDTRDTVYLLAKSYECSLIYLSTLPSLRLFQNYDKEGLMNLLNSDSYQEKVHFKVKTGQLNPQDKTHLMSPLVENIIAGDEEYGVFSEEGELGGVFN
jgi:primosomal protein N'